MKKETRKAAVEREGGEVMPQPGERIGALPDIPESARLALEYAVWVCQKDGREFANGTTAAWWHLCATLAKHLKPNERTRTNAETRGPV